jgi:LemA protein
MSRDLPSRGFLDRDRAFRYITDSGGIAGWTRRGDGPLQTTTGTVAALAAVAVLSGYLVWLYNRLVRLRNLSRSSWSDIDVLLKKRHDLVGNLVEVVKGYADYEKATLLGVTDARARAMRAEGPAERGKEEDVLRGRLSSLFAVAEAYPGLKANESYLELQKQLAEIENGIEYARRYYNAVVRDYNTAAETFPSNLAAPVLGFGRGEFFQLDSPAERERTDVRLS